MRIAVFVLVCLGLVSCEKDDDVKVEIPPFSERVTVQELESVSGTLQYYCELDTSFVYLKPDDETLDPLIIELEDFKRSIQKWFLILYEWYPCEPIYNYYIQDPNLKILISGSVKQHFQSDTLLSGLARPFVIDTLMKIRQCPVVYEKSKVQYPLQDTKWSFEMVMIGIDTLYTTCEFSDIHLVFTSQLYEDKPRDINDSIYQFEYRFGSGSGCLYYYSYEGNKLSLDVDFCLLGFTNVTADMSYLGSELSQLLGMDSYQESVPYTIEGNTLTIGSQESGYAVFVAEGD